MEKQGLRESWGWRDGEVIGEVTEYRKQWAGEGRSQASQPGLLCPEDSSVSIPSILSGWRLSS